MGQTGQSILTVAKGFLNEGTIELTNEVGGYPAQLSVTTGTLTNAVGVILGGNGTFDLSSPSTFATLANPVPDRIAGEVRHEPTIARLVMLSIAPTLAAITNRT